MNSALLTTSATAPDTCDSIEHLIAVDIWFNLPLLEILYADPCGWAARFFHRLLVSHLHQAGLVAGLGGAVGGPFHHSIHLLTVKDWRAACALLEQLVPAEIGSFPFGLARFDPGEQIWRRVKGGAPDDEPMRILNAGELEFVRKSQDAFFGPIRAAFAARQGNPNNE